MNTNHLTLSDNAPAWMAHEAPRKTLWQRLFGVQVKPQVAEQKPKQADADSVLFDYGLEPNTQTEVNTKKTGAESGVFVSRPGRSPLEAFKDAITDGTRVFCEQNVHPLYIEDKQTKFRVTGIKMYVPRAKHELMAVIEQLPIDVRNRLARLRAQNAPGAAEQLVFDDSFFGITIDIEPTVIDGQYVSLIASWSGTSVDIKMAFSGQYVTVKAPVEIKPATVTQPPVEAASVEVKPSTVCAANVAPELPQVKQSQQVDTMATPVNLPDSTLRDSAKPLSGMDSTMPDVLSTKRVSRDTVTAIDPPSPTRVSHETPLGLPQQQKHGKDTYIPAVQRRPIARLHLLPHGESKESVVEICADMFPFVIGREHKASGRFEHGYDLGVDGDDPSVMLISREHLELRFEPNQNHFQIVNHAFDRNGTYHNGCAVPLRFIFKASGNQNALVLGGPSGPGTVRAVFEVI